MLELALWNWVSVKSTEYFWLFIEWEWKRAMNVFKTCSCVIRIVPNITTNRLERYHCLCPCKKNKKKTGFVVCKIKWIYTANKLSKILTNVCVKCAYFFCYNSSSYMWHLPGGFTTHYILQFGVGSVIRYWSKWKQVLEPTLLSLPKCNLIATAFLFLQALCNMTQGAISKPITLLVTRDLWFGGGRSCRSLFCWFFLCMTACKSALA